MRFSQAESAGRSVSASGHAVPTQGADRVQRLGVVKMRHRDDPRPIGLRSRDDAIGEDRSEGGAGLVRFETPLIQDDKRARGLDEVEDIGKAGEAVGVWREEIDGDEIDAVFFKGLGERQFGEPVVEQPAPELEQGGAPAFDGGFDGFFEPCRLIAPERGRDRGRSCRAAPRRD